MQHTTMGEIAKWTRPVVGWIKINIDASVRRSVAGFGMLARDVDCEILVAATLASVLM